MLYFRSLGCEFSTIELDAKKMSDNDLTLIEDEVNKRIRQQLPINVDCYSSKDDPAFPKVWKQLFIKGVLHPETYFFYYQDIFTIYTLNIG